MHYRVIVRVLTPLIHCSCNESLVFDSTFVHFSPKAMGKLPIGFIGVKMGYLVDVECTSNSRDIGLVKCTPLTGRKDTLSVYSNFFQRAKILKINFDEY